ncbi:MAG: hypothetical protein WKF64_03945 [Ilumatobacteraceae bacterium]
MSDPKRKTWTILGVMIALAGVVAGALLWFAASKKYDDAIDSLAPAPVGCDTTLQFDRAGTFFVFAETKGEVDNLDGDCANDEQAYDGSDESLDIVMFDENSNEVDLQRETDLSYDNGTSRGNVLYSLEIEDEGDYTLRVQGDDDEVVARVGSDPNDGVGLLRIAAVAALVAGLVLGLLFILLGRRRRPADRTPGTGDYGWDAQPVAPPGMPPYTPSPTPGHHPAPAWGEPGQATPPQPAPPSRTPGGGWGGPNQVPPPTGPPSQPWQPPSR